MPRTAWAMGTLASLVALPLGYLLHRGAGFPLLLVATAALAVAGGWAAKRPGPRPREAGSLAGDVAGQWVALFPLSAGLWLMGAHPAVFPWPGWVGAFLTFRLLQLWKPGWLGRAERGGGARAVLSDLAAGALAALVVAGAAAISHGVLM